MIFAGRALFPPRLCIWLVVFPYHIILTWCKLQREIGILNGLSAKRLHNRKPTAKSEAKRSLRLTFFTTKSLKKNTGDKSGTDTPSFLSGITPLTGSGALNSSHSPREFDRRDKSGLACFALPQSPPPPYQNRQREKNNRLRECLLNALAK